MRIAIIGTGVSGLVTAPAPAWFRASDYLGEGETDIRDAVGAAAEQLTGRSPKGPIRMLTHLRYLGFAMNPVTFYYCFREDGESLDLILAEITNTPWKERHVYALQADQANGSPARRPHRFAKAFHICQWSRSTPGDSASQARGFWCTWRIRRRA